MGLDIRFPIGLFFTLVGALLAGYGLFGDKAIYERSLRIDVNLWWGLAMLLMGIVFLLLSRRHTSTMHPSDESSEGRAIEAPERATGLESSDGFGQK